MNYDMATMAQQHTILRGLVGSTIHGLNVQDGLEDRDEMGVCIEDVGCMVGWPPFEQYIYRTAQEREQRHDAKSRAGDLDLTIFSLRKYLYLALKGNPTVLNLLFVPASECVVRDARGAQLQELVPYITSKDAGKSYLGYLQAQRQRLTGERGQKNVNRPELVKKFGYDTKYAMHMLRLGYQGVEIMQTGKLSLPMREPERSFLFDVRQGKYSMNDCLTRAGELESELKDLIEHGPLPDKPDRDFVEQWMVNMYLQNWKARDTHAVVPMAMLELRGGMHP